MSQLLHLPKPGPTRLDLARLLNKNLLVIGDNKISAGLLLAERLLVEGARVLVVVDDQHERYNQLAQLNPASLRVVSLSSSKPLTCYLALKELMEVQVSWSAQHHEPTPPGFVIWEEAAWQQAGHFADLTQQLFMVALKHSQAYNLHFIVLAAGEQLSAWPAQVGQAPYLAYFDLLLIHRLDRPSYEALDFYLCQRRATERQSWWPAWLSALKPAKSYYLPAYQTLSQPGPGDSYLVDVARRQAGRFNLNQSHYSPTGLNPAPAWSLEASRLSQFSLEVATEPQK